MTFRQVYYTSCEHGLRGGKGFQINGASPDIDAAVLQQVERLGLYVPPVSAPSRPSQEEIAGFPVSLIFERLGDGAALLGQARYTGADYSGRFGNYFTHALITADPEGDLKQEGLLPIELWQSELWSTTESPTTSLPPLAHLEAGVEVGPEQAAEFLLEDHCLKHLPAFLTAVENALTTGRRIIMVDKTPAVALWIAAASYALPRHLALKLTFSTYVKNPYQNDFLVVGTTSDSDFTFAPHEIEHQFSVFDFEGGRFTTLGEITPFSQMVAAAYSSALVHAIAGFAKFVERVAPDLAVEELDAAFAFHLRGAGVESPIVSESRLLGWSAKRLNGFDLPELRELMSTVAAPDKAAEHVIEAYEELYLAALRQSTRRELRELIELPYLEWLVQVAAKDVSLAKLNQAAQTLHVEASIKDKAAPLVMLWVKQVRQCPDVCRLPALFAIADKLGFFDESEEALRLVGEEVIGPSLAEPPVTEVLLRYTRPGMRSVIDGVGVYLGRHVGRPEAFRPLAAALAQPEIFQTLASHAIEQQSLALYFRLVGARLPQATSDPDQRLKAFGECLAAIRTMGAELTGELVNNAYDAVWQDALPSFDEAIALLDLLESAAIRGTGIPKRLTDLVASCDVRALDARQHELLDRLCARRTFYASLGERQPIIDAYRIPVELASSGEALPLEIAASLDFLQEHSRLGNPLISGAYWIISQYLTQVKDVEQHTDLLVRAFRHGGGPAFLEGYGSAFVAVLESPTKTRPKVAARLTRIGTTASQLGARIIASTIFEEFLPRALKKWRSKELREVENELGHDKPALLRWQKSLKILEEENSSVLKGLRGLIRFNRGGPEKTG